MNENKFRLTAADLAIYAELVRTTENLRCVEHALQALPLHAAAYKAWREASKNESDMFKRLTTKF